MSRTPDDDDDDEIALITTHMDPSIHPHIVLYRLQHRSITQTMAVV